MKLKFKQQQFQTDAVTAVTDLFKGQPRRQDTFTITNEKQLSLDAGLGFRNALTITDERIMANMNEIQRRFSLAVKTIPPAILTWKWKRVQAKPTFTQRRFMN